MLSLLPDARNRPHGEKTTDLTEFSQDPSIPYLTETSVTGVGEITIDATLAGDTSRLESTASPLTSVVEMDSPASRSAVRISAADANRLSRKSSAPRAKTSATASGTCEFTFEAKVK